MNHLKHLIENKSVFFKYMNENFTIFKDSNLFLRDLQYAIMSYFEIKEKSLKYHEAEFIALKFIDELVSAGDLTKIDHKSWRINFEIVESRAETEGVSNE